MIFVTVGTTQYPFKRLAKAVNSFARNNPNEKVTIQAGNTKSFEKAQNVSVGDFYAFDKMEDLIKSANIVITQAGEGSIFQALLLADKPPIVVPRNPKYNEHVDRQQLEITDTLKKRRLAIILDKPSDLEKTVKNYYKFAKKLNKFEPEKSGLKKIVEVLTNFVECY